MNEEIKKMVSEHIDERIYHINPDEMYACEGLFDPTLWEATTSLDHYIFERALDLLIVCGDTDDLMTVGVNDEGKTLYRRIV